MYTMIEIGTGIFWTLAYILVIRRSFQDKTYGIPLVAICANVSWEFIFSFIYPATGIVQRSVNVVWFIFDVIILYQLFKYGLREFRDLSRNVFYAMLGLTLLTSFGLLLFTAKEFPELGSFYTAFGSNVLMSVLFIAMLYRRKSLRGQSIWIALCKMLGTATISLGLLFQPGDTQGSVLLPSFYVANFTYDLIYFVLVYMQRKMEATTGRQQAPA